MHSPNFLSASSTKFNRLPPADPLTPFFRDQSPPTTNCHAQNAPNGRNHHMPSKKIDIDTLKVVLQRNELDGRKIAQILEDLALLTKEEEEKEKEPAVKKQYVPIISDPNGELDGKTFTGWVVQIPEEEPPMLTLEKIYMAAYEFNTSPKGRKMPVETIADACEVISPKIAKEMNLWIKNKEPVEFIRTDNTIPLEQTEKRVKRAQQRLKDEEAQKAREGSGEEE
jgi:hypothetical protein